MELNLAQLRTITLGALDIREEDGGFLFSRMTPEQTAAFTRADAEFALKCGATSGIRLDFYTDSPILALRWADAVITSARTFCYFDVLVDGVLTLHSGTMDCSKVSRGSFCLTLPEGLHRVQVIFPTLTKLTIAAVSLADGATVMPHRCAKRILLHGDSITQGYDALFPSACYAGLLAQHYDAEIVNQAIGGAFFDPDVVERVGDFDFAVVAYGTNDWDLLSGEKFAAGAEAFLKRFGEVYGDTPVFVILPIWRTDTHRTDTAGDFMACRDLIARLARAQGFHVVDDYHLLPHDTRLFSDGYLHPNDLGFAFYAQRLCQVIGETLSQ